MLGLIQRRCMRKQRYARVSWLTVTDSSLQALALAKYVL